MVTHPTRPELGFATLAGIGAVAGSYAVTGWERSFVAAPVDQLVVNLTPGPIIAFMIQNVGEEAHFLHIGMALAAVTGLFAALSFAGLRTADRLDSWIAGGTFSAVAAAAVAAAITGSVASSSGAALPAGVLTAAAATRHGAPTLDASKRRTLGTAVGGLALVAGAVGVGRVGSDGDSPAETTVSGDIDERLAEAETRQFDLASDDLVGLVSPIEEFYNVDIAEFDPQIPAEEWSLTFSGETTGEPMTVDYDGLRELPTEHRYVTLRCVGEGLNGRKLDTALWTGTPIEGLLREVDPAGECGCVMLHGEDGYSVQFPAEVLADGFLAWEMNGQVLPESHGHPVRVLIPGHWGETNVKWLTEIEALDEAMDGYWEQRGWRGTGTVNTVAKLWDEGVARLDDGRIELAGHAYAGTRGISRVEVSTDGGDSWVDAALSDPLPDDDVWRQWRHRFEPSGSSEVVVRAVDGNGVRQSSEQSDSYPSGASGWVTKMVDP